MANFSPVDDGPLPPHERSWRHPSELGPPPPEPTTTGGRVLIVSTATLGLLLVGVLVLTMTPRQSASPVAASSTVSALRSAPTPPPGPPALPLVTPVGDGWGVTTADAVPGTDGERVEVRLVSGDIVDAEVVGTDPAGDVTLVSLPADPDAEHLEFAATQPGPTDTVLVRSADPIVVTMDELATLEVDEATPVMDGRGRLVGLCTGSPDELRVAPVDAVRTPPPTTTTAAPTTTDAPTTVRPPTTVATTPPTSGRPTTTTGPSTSSTSSSTTVPPSSTLSADRDASGEGG